MNKLLRQELLVKLLHVVYEAGQIARNYHEQLFDRKATKWSKKDDGTPVTQIDLEINQLMAEFAEQNSLGFIGEEGNGAVDCQYQLLVDPIDGTGAFMRAMNTSTIIASVLEITGSVGKPILAVIHAPVGGQTWYTLGEETVYLRKPGRVPRAVYTINDTEPPWLTTIVTWPGADYHMNVVKSDIEHDARFQEQSMGAVGICAGLIASGIIDGAIFPPGSAVETAAMQLIVQGAGGWTIDLEGGPLGPYELGELRGKTDFLLPHGAIFTASEAVAIALFDVVRDVNGWD